MKRRDFFNLFTFSPAIPFLTKIEKNNENLFEVTYTYNHKNDADYHKGVTYKYDDSVKKEFELYFYVNDNLSFNKPIKVLKFEPSKNIIVVTTNI